MHTLIIEDSKTIAHIVSSTLSSYGYLPTLLNSHEVSLKNIKTIPFEILIIDTDLERRDTLELLNEIKDYFPAIHTLGISNSSSWEEKVEFLNGGGDDVLSYPFPLQELMARIQSLLRRPKDPEANIIDIDEIVVDTRQKKAYKRDKEINLGNKEYSLLEYMARNKNRTISRSELYDHVWDYRRYNGSNTIDVHIKKLRTKLKTKKLIKTIYGFGYKMSDSDDEEYQSIKRPKFNTLA